MLEKRLAMQKLLQNKNIIITGGSNGIGYETALALAEMGASMWIVGRNESRLIQSVKNIMDSTGNQHVDYFVTDLSSLHSINDLSGRIKTKLDHLDVLVNNAGALFVKRHTSVDGLEMTFALNHLNYFYLSNLLLDLMKQTGKARIVNVSSAAHFSGNVGFDDLQSEKGYNPMVVYGTSKLMNLLFTYELVRHLNGDGITVNALHPGFVASNFGRSNGGLLDPLFKVFQLGAINPRQGAKTSVYLASSDDVEGVTGKYFYQCQEIKSSKDSYNRAVASRLWEETQLLIKSRG